MTPDEQAKTESDIHKLTAQVLRARLAEMVESGEFDAAAINAALRFCKDNSIAAFPVPGGVVEGVADGLSSLPFPATGTD